MPDYRVIPGSPQDNFSKLRTKLQVFGGAYGNGKTAAACVNKCLVVALDYPGANILMARSTYPKLNDTLRKEFIKWCDPTWIKSFPKSKNSDNTCTLINGTTINFRYIAQQGKGIADGEQTTSNLLSATYDLIVIDQLEDPEITEKDFRDLFGRLRGSTKYAGDDPTMPKSGPRWFIAMINPTRNWVYRTVIAPFFKYQKTGKIDEHLFIERHPRDLPDGRPHPQADEPVLNGEGKPILLMDMVEGSTYTNQHNLDADFIKTLESLYTGQSRDRFLYGEWAAYEGLVHPDFSEVTHCYSRYDMMQVYNELVAKGIVPTFIEAYDFGIIVPSCYVAAFVDRFNNVFIFDGFYEPEATMRISKQQDAIWEIRNEWGIEDGKIRADPSLWKRTQIQKDSGAKTIATLFNSGRNAVKMSAADNEIARGIIKTNIYLTIADNHRDPFNGAMGAPHLYIATELQWMIDEFTSYYWKTDTSGARFDVPIDKNDHAMNTVKYLLSKQPDLATRIKRIVERKYLTQWSEVEQTTANQFTKTNAHRYGNGDGQHRQTNR